MVSYCNSIKLPQTQRFIIFQSGSQKFKMDQQGCAPPGDFEGESGCFSFPAFGLWRFGHSVVSGSFDPMDCSPPGSATCSPWLVAPSSIFKASRQCGFIESLFLCFHCHISFGSTLLPPSYKDPCDHIGPPRYSRILSQLKVFNTSVKSPLQCEVTYSHVPRIRTCTFWGGTMILSATLSCWI